MNLLVACKSNATITNKSIDSCLGDYSYDSSIAALVYEQIEGEEDGFFGIQYREVLDLNSLTLQSEQAICLYFYNPVNTQSLGVTAGVEDLAQTLEGRVLFIAIDAFTEANLSSAYEVEAYPEFILIKDGARVSTFSGIDYSNWNMEDVAYWMASNGFEPDYSKLSY